MTKVLLATALMSFLTHAQADISPSCKKEIKENLNAIVQPAYEDDVEGIKAQLAKKIGVQKSQLTYSKSMSAGDGAASFTVIVFELKDSKGNLSGWYSVTAYDGTEIVSYTLIGS